MTLPTLLPFLIILIFQVWIRGRESKNIGALDGFTDQEKAILRLQLVAVLPLMDFSLAFLLFVMKVDIHFIVLGLHLSLMKMIMLFADLGIGYIAISSIKNRVSILRPRWRKGPTKGTPALINGIIFLAGGFIVLGFLLF